MTNKKNTLAIDLTNSGHVLPIDGGQIVQRRWHAAGEHGAVCVTVDRSDGTATYRLHRWLRGGSFEPWNGETGARRRGRRITAEEALRLVGGAS